MKATILILALFFGESMSSHAHGKDLVPVEVGFLEALAETESSPSDRYREQYQAAIFYAMGESEQKLNRCGYHYRVTERYFDSNDKVMAQKYAAELKAAGTWLVFAPRRSDHFLAMAQVIQDVPAVSPMANAAAVTKLEPPFFTTYPSIQKHAVAAVHATKKEKYGPNYGSAVDVTCPSCRDFENDFFEAGQGVHQRKFRVELVGKDDSQLEGLVQTLEKTPVDFLILPNFAEISAAVILKLEDRFPKLKFVGADGWGDGRVGYFNQFGFKKHVRGFCVRGGASSEEMKKKFRIFSLDRNWAGKSAGPSNSTFYMVHFFRELTQIICDQRPKGREEFVRYLRGLKKERFLSPQGIGVYKLQNSELSYGYPIR